MAPINTSHAGWCGSAPVTKARRRVRAISWSLWCSTYWLKAPALAEATSTDSANTSTSIQLGAGPGVTTMPTNAVTMMSEPMRSLNSETTSRVRCAARLRIGSSVSVVMVLSLGQDMPHSCARYFQLMK